MLVDLMPISEDDNIDIPRAGLGLFKKYYHLEHQGIGHEGGDLGYAANMFYFPEIETSISYLVNYGTNGDSALKSVFEDFDLAIMSKLQD
jgi:hypothetical protein